MVTHFDVVGVCFIFPNLQGDLSQGGNHFDRGCCEKQGHSIERLVAVAECFDLRAAVSDLEIDLKIGAFDGCSPTGNYLPLHSMAALAVITASRTFRIAAV